MKYQNYAEYKDSGVEWLDQVPVHWAITSLKMLIDVRDGTHDTPAYVEIGDSSFPLVTSKDVTSGVLSFELCKHISEEDYLSIIKRSKVDVGDIIMPMIGTVGSPIVVYERDDFAIKNLALFKTSKNQNINTSFLNYFLQSSECEIQFSLEARGGVQNFVSLGVLRDLGFPKIPNEEQTKIANFLDHETAKIDALIEKQQHLIKLLKEKRQAVISHAVTKGLNPNAPMRDSGVEWLGDGVNITAQPALSLGGLNNLPFLRVPLNEQDQIIEFVKSIKIKFDALTLNAEHFISLAQERRTALISAAVTGKIDVRNWQTTESLHNNKETHNEEAA